MDNHFKLALLLSSLIGVTACNSDDTTTKTSTDYITDEYVGEISTPVDDEELVDDENEENTFLNGSFEDWTGGQPDSWTTIDTGITVSQNNDIYYTDVSSAEILVTTGTQGDTDIRQYVDVVSGTTYLFTAWVYHTEGYVSARLYVDGYHDYSSTDLVNQWQKVSYSYTADEDKSIEVGLRFYDQTGFDLEEIVYVDSITFAVDDGTGDEDTAGEDDSAGDDTTGDDSTSGEDDTGDDTTGDDSTSGEDDTGDDTTNDDSASEAKTLLNGDFEAWTDGQPDSWETIDTGITLTQSNDIYYTDASSAEVLVTTATQGDTDIRQYVDVVSGTTYLFTTWVYHTDGNVSARLYVDGYQDYSSTDLVNQWQQVSYSYTADEDKSIEVGLRFYDQEGFDVEEIVYVDNITFAVDDGTGDEDTAGEDDSASSEDDTSDDTTVDDSTSGEDDTSDDSTGDDSTGDDSTGDDSTGDDSTSEAKTLLNGDFETWTDGQPDSWETIDTGITLTQNNDIYYTDASSAEVLVTTATQGDTDIRQYVDVVSGTTYLFTTWVYHTDGYVSARLYVDGYQDYSSTDLVNQWQQVSYSYTADEDKSIEVGLRFYDQEGFDVEEIVYVDSITFAVDDGTGDEDTAGEDDSTGSEDGTGDDDSTSGEDVTSTTLILNQDFESWTNTLPDDWTTIDTDITLTQNTSIYHAGSSSAQVSVNSVDQGATDIRQSVEVVADTTYTYTTWVYHTDGFVKARLYIDGYESYSDNTLLNQWQQLNVSFTATETTSIEVGVRFYDQTGYVDPEIVYIDDFSLEDGSSSDASTYYNSADGLSGLELKTALYNIIKDHTTKTYADLWDFIGTNSLDSYYEEDATILDMYSENPSTSETFNFTAFDDQCGNYSVEGDCYNREHSFPKSWFDDAFPMYTDIHHIFGTDGYVNGRRSNYPYGEVGTSTWVSENGSLLGSSTDSLGYTGTVFEPIDEFKGDFARAYFYMATRYEDIISTWEVNSDNGAVVLDSTSDYVYEEWVITMLKTWNENDPVSQKEIDRNEAAYEFQGNRNPFIDHPEYVNQIWVD